MVCICLSFTTDVFECFPMFLISCNNITLMYKPNIWIWFSEAETAESQQPSLQPVIQFISIKTRKT